MGEFLTFDDILRFLYESNSSVSEDVHRYNAQFATTQDSTGVWRFKRDPKTSEGFVPLDLWRYVQMIECPVLMMIGEESLIVPTEVREKMGQILPRSEIDVIPNAGHLIVHEQPELFASSARKFLRNIRF
jgi:pimeloyl-ACP methyl ester carboxylesterase